jgi:hypothetical protein
LNKGQDQSVSHFAFEMTDEDDRIFRKAAWRSLRPLINKRISKGIPLAVYIGMCGALFIAYVYEVLPGSAMFAALGSFVLTYFSMVIASLMSMAQLRKAQFGLMSSASKQWDIVLDDDWIVVKTALVESRMTWAAIERVEDVGSMVIFWYRLGAGFLVPSRAFADDQVRAGFTTWATARAQAAATSPNATVAVFA